MSDEKKTNSTEEEQEPIEQLPIKEEFELREKRLKLVYKILYVAAALWGMQFICCGMDCFDRIFLCRIVSARLPLHPRNESFALLNSSGIFAVFNVFF